MKSIMAPPPLPAPPPLLAPPPVLAPPPLALPQAQQGQRLDLCPDLALRRPCLHPSQVGALTNRPKERNVQCRLYVGNRGLVRNIEFCASVSSPYLVEHLFHSFCAATARTKNTIPMATISVLAVMSRTELSSPSVHLAQAS